jgi:hypothetical protein
MIPEEAFAGRVARPHIRSGNPVSGIVSSGGTFPFGRTETSRSRALSTLPVLAQQQNTLGRQPHGIRHGIADRRANGPPARAGMGFRHLTRPSRVTRSPRPCSDLMATQGRSQWLAPVRKHDIWARHETSKQTLGENRTLGPYDSEESTRRLRCDTAGPARTLDGRNGWASYTLARSRPAAGSQTTKGRL